MRCFVFISVFTDVNMSALFFRTYFLMIVTSPCGPNLMMELGV